MLLRVKKGTVTFNPSCISLTSSPKALQDALSIEQKMWSNVEGTINGDIISTGAAAILNNQLKTTDPKNVPKILPTSLL